MTVTLSDFRSISSAAKGVSLDQALWFFDRGFSVIPLGPTDDERDDETLKQRKTPDWRVLPKGDDGKPTWKPFQETKASRKQLTAWFGNGIPRNAGLVCGPSCGVYLIVIETDTDEAEAAAAPVLPFTPMMTRSGRGGIHRFYRAPIGFTTLPDRIFINGIRIELKRLGQQVVAPGSLHPNGNRYEMLGEWPSLEEVPVFPEDLLIRLSLDPSVNIPTSSGLPRIAPPLPEVVPNGDRNNTLFREAGRLRRLGWTEDEIYTALTGLNKRTTTKLDNNELRKMAKSVMRYAPAADVFPLTESGDAEYFAAVNADLVRFDHLRERWLVFQEHHWRPPTTGEVHRLALDAMRGRQDAAKKVSDDAEQKRRKLWAIKGEERKRLTNMLKLAENILPLADDGENWDKDPWLLGVTNGVVDLRTGLLRDGRPEDRITMRTACAFDPEATCPLFDQTIAEIFGHDAELIAYMDRFFGYSLTGDCREEKLAICWGDGGNGKGTLLNTVGKLLKDYTDTLPFSSLEVQKHGELPPYDLAKLVGKRFVTASETLDERRLNEGRIKALTGRDPVDARFPYGRWFSYVPNAKFWLSTNVKPKTEDTSEGWWRRVEFIPFTQSFKDKPETGQKAANQQLKDQLMEELPGILARFVRGCLEWQRRGLDSPPVVREATKQYRAESEPLQKFLDDCCVLGDNKLVSSGALFEAYCRWAKMQDGIRLGNQRFYAAMEKRFQRVEGRPVQYRGVGLVDMRYESREDAAKAAVESAREAVDGGIPF